MEKQCRLQDFLHKFQKFGPDSPVLLSLVSQGTDRNHPTNLPSVRLTLELQSISEGREIY